MDCPPSSPPRLLPGFAPNKNAKFEIFHDINHALPSPLPTSERDVASSPSSEANEAVMPARSVLKQLRTLKLRPDIPVLVGRSSRACEFALETKSKLVSRIHARCCYESATDLITVECLGWNGLTMIVPTSKGPKDYPVVRDQTIYIEKVNGVELSIQNTRTFIEVVTGPSETTEDEVDPLASAPVAEAPAETSASTTQLEPQHKNIIDKTLMLLRSKVNALASPVSEPTPTPGPSQTNEPTLVLKSVSAIEPQAGSRPESVSETNLDASSGADVEEPSEKENLQPKKRVHFELPNSKIGLTHPKITTLAEYRKRRLSMGQAKQPEQPSTSENTLPLEPAAKVAEQVAEPVAASTTEPVEPATEPVEPATTPELDVKSASGTETGTESVIEPVPEVEMEIESETTEPVANPISQVEVSVETVVEPQPVVEVLPEVQTETVAVPSTEAPAIAEQVQSVTSEVKEPSEPSEGPIESTPELVSAVAPEVYEPKPSSELIVEASPESDSEAAKSALESAPESAPELAVDSTSASTVEPAPEPAQTLEVTPTSETSEASTESVVADTPQLHITKTTNKKRKAADSKAPAAKKARKQANTSVPTQDPTSIDSQTIENLATNCVAFSRLNSTPLSHIVGSSHEFEGVAPALVAEILQQVACIGVIQREGKDALGKPLEPEYYYVSEMDTDSQRKQMVLQSKGGKSLRACRRVHKQYFYKRPK